MAHRNWCGKPCESCAAPCPQQNDMPCFLDCCAVREDGSIDGMACRGQKCVKFHQKEGECPVCGEEMSLDSGLEMEEYLMYEKWRCKRCDAGITAVYNTVFHHYALNY